MHAQLLNIELHEIFMKTVSLRPKLDKLFSHLFIKLSSPTKLLSAKLLLVSIFLVLFFSLCGKLVLRFTWEWDRTVFKSRNSYDLSVVLSFAATTSFFQYEPHLRFPLTGTQAYSSITMPLCTKWAPRRDSGLFTWNQCLTSLMHLWVSTQNSSEEWRNKSRLGHIWVWWASVHKLLVI